MTNKFSFGFREARAALFFGLASIAISGAAQASVHTVTLTGITADFSHSQFSFDGNLYDRFILTPLNGLEPSGAITVSQGDVINSTVTLNTSYFIPTSSKYTNILQIFTGSSFPSDEDADIQGTFDFYLGGSLVRSFDYSSYTSGGIASYAVNFPPDNAGFKFDSFTNDFQITTLGTPATVDASYFFYDLVTPAPEPATWAMFLVGFGTLGFMMRGSRRKGAAVTA